MNLQCRQCGTEGERYSNDSMCKECRKARSKRERALNPQSVSARNRRWRIRAHGITEDEYDALVSAHDDRCAICGATDPRAGRWHIDHDHEHCSGTHGCPECIRGLLCSPCNLGIGYLQESTFILESAMAYLRGVRPVTKVGG